MTIQIWSDKLQHNAVAETATPPHILTQRGGPSVVTVTKWDVSAGGRSTALKPGAMIYIQDSGARKVLFTMECVDYSQQGAGGTITGKGLKAGGKYQE